MARGLEVLRKYKRLCREPSRGQDPGRGHLRHPRSAETARTTWCASARRPASGRGWSRARGRRGSSTWPRSTASTSRASARSSSTSAGAAWSWPSGTGTQARLGGVGEARGAAPGRPLREAATPWPGKDEERLEAFVEAVPGTSRGRWREAARPFCVVGTSGTILALGRLAHQIETGEVAGVAQPRHGEGADARASCANASWRLPLRERLRLPGMDEPRADILPVGAVILDTILRRLGVEELVLCEWALREGILLDYIHRHPRTLARAEAYPDVRRRSVMALAERCQYDEAHARHIAELALQLFDAHAAPATASATASGALLEYAALLHDIGHHISYPGHHKHTYYLIKNGDLRGFDPAEIEVLANVARYHRRGHPQAEAPRLRRPAQRGAPGGVASWPGSCASPTPSTAATSSPCARLPVGERAGRCSASRPRPAAIASSSSGGGAARWPCSRKRSTLPGSRSTPSPRRGARRRARTLPAGLRPDGRAPPSHADAEAPANAPPPPPEPPRPFAVVDLGASAVRLVVAEVPAGRAAAHPRGGLARRAARQGHLHPRPAGRAPPSRRRSRCSRASAGSWTPTAWCATARSPPRAVREAGNRDDLPRPRAPAHRDRRGGHRRHGGEPPHLHGGARDAARPRGAAPRATRCCSRWAAAAPTSPSCARASPSTPAPTPWARSACARTSPPGTAATSSGVRLLRRHIHNVVEDIRREMPLREAKHFIALGGDVRFAAARIAGGERRRATASRRSRATRSSPSATRPPPTTWSSWSSSYRLPQAEAETLVPGPARQPRAAARDERRRDRWCPRRRCAQGLLLDLARAEEGREHRGLQQAGAGQRPGPGREVPLRRRPRPERGPPLGPRSSTSCRPSTACPSRDRAAARGGGAAPRHRQLREPARPPQALAVHPVRLRDLRPVAATTWTIVANVARYHRRATPAEVAPALHGARQRHARRR